MKNGGKKRSLLLYNHIDVLFHSSVFYVHNSIKKKLHLFFMCRFDSLLPTLVIHYAGFLFRSFN